MCEQARDYDRAYKWLYSQAPLSLQVQLTAAKDNDSVPPKEVTDFCKRVIELAERGS